MVQHSEAEVKEESKIQIDIGDIISMGTANLVLAALVVSLVGATIAISIRHYTSQNWLPHIEDVWYYVLSAGTSIALVLLGADTVTILGATTGINTPLALVKTGIDKYTARNGSVKLGDATLADIQKELAKRG